MYNLNLNKLYIIWLIIIKMEEKINSYYIIFDDGALEKNNY